MATSGTTFPAAEPSASSLSQPVGDPTAGDARGHCRSWSEPRAPDDVNCIGRNLQWTILALDRRGGDLRSARSAAAAPETIRAMSEAIPGPLGPTRSQSRIAPSWPRSIAIAGGGGLVVGVLTSIGQSVLPDEMRSLANAASPWSAAAFALAVVAGGRDTLRSAILAAGSLLRCSPATASRAPCAVPRRRLHDAVLGRGGRHRGPALGVGAAWSRGTDRAEGGRGRGGPGVDPRRGGGLRADGHRRLDLTRLLDGPARRGPRPGRGPGSRSPERRRAALCAALTAAGAAAIYVLYSGVYAPGLSHGQSDFGSSSSNSSTFATPGRTSDAKGMVDLLGRQVIVLLAHPPIHEPDERPDQEADDGLELERVEPSRHLESRQLRLGELLELAASSRDGPVTRSGLRRPP